MIEKSKTMKSKKAKSEKAVAVPFDAGAAARAMSKELLLVVDAVANEKGVDKDVIFDAMEAALASAAKKRYSIEDVTTRVSIDKHSGEYETFRRWEVVADDVVMESPDRQLRLMDAIETRPDIQVGEFIEEPIENPEFGRIAAQAAKQVIVQRVREAERAQVVEAYKDRVGELVTGVVKRVERGSVYLDLGGNAEAYIPRDRAIPREAVRAGDRVRGYLYEVRAEQRGPQLFISRTAPEFMIELFRIEVPEVGQGLVEIKGAARDAGDRAKIAVLAHDHRTDPIGACIGMRGSRVQAVSNELNGERIDIVLWNENPAQYVINAMAPAEVQSIIVDEEKHSMDIAVAEDKLSQAIGRGGQNVRLASKLSGWQLNVMTQDQVAAKSESEQEAARALFQQKLEVDTEIAAILVQEGFTTVEEIAYVPTAELLAVEGFDEDIVEELRARARDALLTDALAVEEDIDENKPADDLLAVDGMDEATAFELAQHGVVSRANLADLATDELMEFGVKDMDEPRAAALIMAARETKAD
jgi:N utilization substance protein A